MVHLHSECHSITQTVNVHAAVQLVYLSGTHGYEKDVTEAGGIQQRSSIHRPAHHSVSLTKYRPKTPSETPEIRKEELEQPPALLESSV